MALATLRAQSILSTCQPSHLSSHRVAFPVQLKVVPRRSMGQDNSRAKTTASSSSSSEASTSAGVPSKADLKQRLTSEQYYVTQQKGTERAFTGKYWNEKKPGVYTCVCCDTPLFESRTKFDSGTGWPSYWDKVGDNVREVKDMSIPFMPRIEVVCGKCDGHLGHVFNDGPRPTGLRYCINSASIDLKPQETQ